MPDTRVRDVWSMACLAWAGLALMSAGHDVYQFVLWSMLGLSSVAVVAWAVMFSRLWSRPAWTLVAIATFLGTVSYQLWASDLVKVAIPGGSLVRDVISLAAAVLALAIAVLLLGREHQRNLESGGWLDAGLAFFVLLMPITEFLLFPIWYRQGLSRAESVSLIVLAVLALLLVTASARLWFISDATVNRSPRFLCAGVFASLVIAAFVFALDLAIGSTDGDAYLVRLDAVGAWAFFTMTGMAASDPTARRPPVGDASRGLAKRGRTVILLTASVVMPPLLLVAHIGESYFRSSLIFAAETGLLALLLGIRINLLVLRYRDAIRREHVLRDVNASLMRVTRLEEITRGISDWSARLVEQQGVTCMIGTERELEAAGIGDLGARLPRHAGSMCYRTVVAVPGSRPTRRLVVDTPDKVRPEALATLSVLGQNIGMALERLTLARRSVERATAQRLEMLLHNASDVITLVDGSGTIRYITGAITDMTGSDPAGFTGTQWSAVFDDPPLAEALLSRARANPEGWESAGELTTSPPGAPSPQRIDVNVAWLPDEEEFVVTLHDVTERHNLQRELEYQAFHDELTGLKNRAVFRDELDHASARARRANRSFSVVMLDLDDFKEINDTLGHPFGDDVLRLVGDRLIACMRAGDTPARLGGDEFAAILESTSSVEAAQSVADRILSRIAEPMTIRGVTLSVRASVGVTMSDGSESPEQLERDVDIALYEAKYSGKAMVSVFTDALQDAALNRISIIADLRGAVDRGEITVRYQPIVDLEEGGIAGVEALARWNHRSRGELLPDSFMSYAEESGEILPIGRYVIDRAVADLATWDRLLPMHSGLRLSVNLSGHQLRGGETVASMLASLETHSIEPRRLVAEVTETVLLPGDGQAAGQLRILHDAGVSVYIDDFGTGWSSLQYLRHLPVDGLKVAGEFVSNLPDPIDVSVVRSIHQLSGSLGLDEPIAEGVESAEQSDALKSVGFKLAQGFLLGAPVRADRFQDLLARSHASTWPAAYNRPVPGPRPQPLGRIR